MPRLLEELALAHADGTQTRLLGRLAKVDVLVLDDWGLAPLCDQDRRDMVEIFEERHASRSTIVTSPWPVEAWHDYVADPNLADALLDRVVRNAHRLELNGPSRRKSESGPADLEQCPRRVAPGRRRVQQRRKANRATM
jgi:DNA replication protein DnaC